MSFPSLRRTDASPNDGPGQEGGALLWLSDGALARTFFGRRWLEFRGKDATAESGEGWLTGVHAEDVGAVCKVAEQAAASGEGYTVQYRLQRHDGTYRLIAEEAEPRFDASGEFVGFAGAATDIGGRDDHDEQLQLQIQALEAIGPAIMATDAEGKIIVWNRKAEEIYGWKAEEVLGMPMRDVSIPATAMSEANNVFEKISKGEIWTGETAVRRRDGTVFLARGTVAPLRDGDGNIVGAIGVSEDVSAWRTSQAPAARFGRLLDQSPNEIYIYDAATLHFLQVNRGALENLGYTAEEMRNMTPLDLKKDFDTESYARLLEPLRTGTSDQIIFETTQTRKDGTIYPVETRISLARDEVPPVFVVIIEDITERKAIEAELFQAYMAKDQSLQDLAVSRKRLEDLVENIPGIVWEAEGRLGEPDYRITYVSKQIETVLGYSVEEAQGALDASAFAIVHPDDRQSVMDASVATYEDGQPRTARFRHMAADGRAVWIQSYFSAMTDDAANVTGLRGVNLDITEQQRVEELLNFSIEAGRILASSLDYESTLRNVARLAVPRIADWCAVHLADESGRLQPVSVAHVNPERVEWVRQMQTTARRHPDDPPSPPQMVLETGQPVLVPKVTREMIENRVRDEEARQIVYQLGMRSYMCVPMTRHSQVIGVMTFVAAESGHHFDEADLRAAEHLARRAATAVDNALLYRDAERERARFTTIVASVDYGVCQVDAWGRVEHVNPAAEALLGRTATELQGELLHEIVHGRMEDGEPCDRDDCPVVAVLKRADRSRGDDTFSTRHGMLPVRVNCSPILVAGQLLGAVVAFEDITDRLSAEQRKDDFLAFATHELRNPLTPILGLSRWLERQVQADMERFGTDIAEAVETLTAEGSRMANIVDVFLDLSRIESNRLVLDANPVDLCEVILMEAQATEMRHPNVHMELNIPESGCNATSDEARLRQVLSNLLENAAKYGGESPRIAVTLDQGETEATIRVRDEGPGIPEADQPRIFERFYRSSTSGGKKGYGVGLFLTKEIVSQLGGSISFESKRDRGTEFVVRIPYQMAGVEGAD